MKIRRRLTSFDTPVTWSGPVIVSIRRCGSVVTPAPPPMSVSAIVKRCGAIRSSIGPSHRFRKAADTRCGPAVTSMGGVVIDSPCGRSPLIFGLTGKRATCPPSIETSIFPPLPAVMPKIWSAPPSWVP